MHDVSSLVVAPAGDEPEDRELERRAMAFLPLLRASEGDMVEYVGEDAAEVPSVAGDAGECEGGGVVLLILRSGTPAPGDCR